MKNHHLLVLATLLAAVSPVFGREISGVVLSAADSTAVAGATCSLIANEKSILQSATEANGSFAMHTDVKTALTLKVSGADFAETDIIIESGAKNLNVGTIYLEPSTTLGEVTVTANSVIHSKGRTIVYPSEADVKASTSAVSLFQKLPLAGLEANPITRSLAVDGGSPTILINGVPSTIDDVNSLSPKDIEKIEFSRLTPARYADRGSSGFIDITLKKRTDGGQVYLWGRSAVATAFVDANLRASYHQGPSRFTLYYSPSWRNYHQVYDSSEESLIGSDFRVDMNSYDRNPFNYLYNQVRFRYDYSPNTSTLFSATFSAMPTSNKGRVIGHTFDSETGEYDNYNKNSYKSFAPSLDLFLRKDFNRKNSLQLQVVGTLSSSEYRRNNTYIYADGREDSYIMDADSRRRSLISEASYIHTFSEKTQFSAGYQNTVSHSNNKYLTTDYRPVLTENNNYIYARLWQNVGKVNFSVATGAKLYVVENDMNKRKFIRNLTSAVASWEINNYWNLQGSFQYTPGIPSLTSLTDYPQQTTPYLIANGNPDLKVSQNFTYRISLNYQYKKFSASLMSAFVDTKDGVINDIIYLGDRMFLSQSVNARKRQVSQNDLSLYISDIYGFGAKVYLSLCHYTTAGEGWQHDLTSFDASMTLWWNKGPFTISYWRKFPGKYLNGHIVAKDENGDALEVSYKPNDHWTFEASWMYMFDKKGTRYDNWSYSSVNPSTNRRYIKHNGNMVVLSLTYTADFGSIFRTARRSLNNSDNGSSILEL